MRLYSFLMLLAMFAAHEASAFVLEFSVPGSETIYTAAEVDGFQVTSEHFHLFGDGYFASNGTTCLSYEAGRGRPFTISRVGGGAFALRSFDVAEAVTTAPLDRPAAEAIGVVGYRVDGSTISTQFQLDGIHDGGGGGTANDFQPFALPPSFSNLTSVHFYGIRADGRDGGVAVDNLNVDTGEPSSDTVPPAVTITSPAGGSVAGTISIGATATDANGVTRVQFSVDGVNVGSEVLVPPYLISFDTTGVANGPHTITAMASDAAGNVGTSSVTVNVSNTTVSGVPYYVNFDGLDDYLEVADSESLSFGNGTSDTPLSLELWFRPDSMSTKQNLVGKWGGTNVTREYKLYVAAGTIRMDLMDSVRQVVVSAYTSVSQTALVGGWHHLAVTYDGRGGASAATGIAIYVDGVVVPVTRVNSASYVAMSNTGARLQIGREGPSSKQFLGGLDEIRLWRSVRSQAEIQSHMRSELQGSESGLQAYWRLNEGGGAVAADDSPSGNVAILGNSPVWTSGGSVNPPVLDLTPPQISNIVVGELTDTTATITFVTNELATGSVSFAANGVCPCGEFVGAAGRTGHTIQLTGLSQDMVYEYEAKAVDSSGNAASSSTRTFRTAAAPPDVTAPVVTIANPVAGVVSGMITLTATATDSRGVVGVQFKLDGIGLGGEVLTPPYSIVWDSLTVANGTHTITAEARDASGNVGSTTLVVTVSNGVVVSDPYYLTFDGIDDYVDVTDGDALSFGNGVADTPLTFEAWVRPTSLMTKQNLLSKWGSSNSRREYKLYIAAGTIRLDMMDSVRQATVSAYSTGSLAALAGGWHHLAVTYDGRGGSAAANGITIYVDGVAVPVTRVNNGAYVAMSNTPSALEIGREGATSKQYQGGLDEIRQWRVARSQALIQASMTSELLGDEPGLQAYWKLNEGGGAAIDDSSPSTNVGVLRNGPTWYYGGGLAP